MQAPGLSCIIYRYPYLQISLERATDREIHTHTHTHTHRYERPGFRARLDRFGGGGRWLGGGWAGPSTWDRKAIVGTI